MAPSHASRPRGGAPLAMLLSAAVLWGLCIPVMKALGAEQRALVPELGTITSSLGSLAARFGLAAAAISLLARRSPLRITLFEWRQGLVLGLVTAASMLLQVDGLNYTGASTAGFLIAMYAVLVPVFAWLTGLRKMTPLLLICCSLLAMGIAALTGLDPGEFRLGRGEWENLGAACLFAFQILWLSRLKPEAFDPFRLTVVLCMTVATVAFLALACIPHGLENLPSIHASPRAALLTLALALGGTALPFLAMNRYQPRLDPVQAGFIYCFEPLASVCGALFLPQLLVREASLYANETLTRGIFVGGGLILAANLLLLRDRPE